MSPSHHGPDDLMVSIRCSSTTYPEGWHRSNRRLSFQSSSQNQNLWQRAVAYEALRTFGRSLAQKHCALLVTIAQEMVSTHSSSDLADNLAHLNRQSIRETSDVPQVNAQLSKPEASTSTCDARAALPPRPSATGTIASAICAVHLRPDCAGDLTAP